VAAKAELIEGLKPNGVAVLNADDEWVIEMRDKHKGRTITFGIENPADVTATEIDASRLGLIRFRLQTPIGDAPAVLHMSGRHNLMNALAAAAVATCFDMKPAQIAAALDTARPPRMRGEVLHFAAGFTVVDDSYNSNPRSLVNMVRTITEPGVNARRRIVVAGEMLELGPDELALHRQVGRDIAGAGIDVVWSVRGLAVAIVEGAREAGTSVTRFFESSDDAARAVVDEIREGDLVLVKGSRGVATDKIVAAIRERFPLAE
jgi:UDP-N-acetylmuramoyl-tripeptide--D-alanyl-D-alanine ligase